MSWYNRRPLFSPRAVVQSQKINEFTTRIVPKTKIEYEEEVKEEDSVINLNAANTYDTYPSYHQSYPSYGKNRSKDFRKKVSHETYYNNIESEYFTNRWSNFYFNTVHVLTDKDDQLIVKSPKNYLTPTIAQIKGKVSAYSSDAISTIKELARVCYFKMIEDSDFLDE